MNVFGFHRHLSDEDSALLSNISNAYQLGIGRVDGFRINKCGPPRSLIEYLNGESASYASLIEFYKCIPEFKQFVLSDQIVLIKLNMFSIVHLYYILIRNFTENRLVGKCMTNWLSADFHRQMSRTRHQFDCFMKHPLVLKLVLVVFIFNMNLAISQSGHQDIASNNAKKIYEVQNFYAALLVRYLEHVFGETESVRSMQLIVTQMIQLQTLMSR